MMKKDIFRNPMLYFLLAPAFLALWPLLLWAVHLPDAEKNWQKEKAQYQKAQKIISEILSFDPDRLAVTDAQKGASEFDYATAVEKIASLCRIPPANYKLSSGVVITSKGQKSQSARVSLKQVDITRFAKFLSTIQLSWPNLQCTRLKLSLNKGIPDSWNADFDFKYYF